MTSLGFPKGAHSLGNIKRTLHPPEREEKRNRHEIYLFPESGDKVPAKCHVKSTEGYDGRGGSKRFAHISESFMHHYSRRRAGPAANVEPTSLALTNLVFPVRTKDQPLDKSVFIRKKGGPSLFINLAPAITRSLSPWLHSYPRTSAIRFPCLFDRHRQRAGIRTLHRRLQSCVIERIESKCTTIVNSPCLKVA